VNEEEGDERKWVPIFSPSKISGKLAKGSKENSNSSLEEGRAECGFCGAVFRIHSRSEFFFAGLCRAENEVYRFSDWGITKRTQGFICLAGLT